MLSRRNSFPGAGTDARKPPKMGVQKPERLKPSASFAEAELAKHLVENPVFVDLFELLKKEALARFCNSSLGEDGTAERDTARLEWEALSTIEKRLGALAAEISLHAAREDLSGD